MFRALVVRALQCAPKNLLNKPYQNPIKFQLLPTSTQTSHFSTLLQPTSSPLLSNLKIQNISNELTRTITKYSWGKGKRKSNKSVIKRFYRLNWGGWIHTKCGKNKKIWKKHAARKRRLRQHVMCNATQNTLLDKMVGSFWRKPKYYVEDPYEPYHNREEFTYTYRKPKPYYG